MNKLKIYLTAFMLFFVFGYVHAQNDSAHVEQTTIKAVKETKLKQYKENGQASYYGTHYSSKQKTASGERFNKNKLTAAHKTLPFGTKVKVTNKDNGKSVIVTINDRGPYKKGRIIDLSPAAFKVIHQLKKGLVNVSLEIIKT